MSTADDIARLESERRVLAEALAEFEHEARRVRDQLERRSGQGFVLEDRLDQIERNIAATRRDLDNVRDQLDRIERDAP